MKNKLGILQDEQEHEFKYSNNWWLQKYPNFTRVVVAPSGFHIDIMLEIAKRFPEPFWILYILVVSRVGNEPGRYQCPQPVTFKELESFCLFLFEPKPAVRKG